MQKKDMPLLTSGIITTSGSKNIFMKLGICFQGKCNYYLKNVVVNGGRKLMSGIQNERVKWIDYAKAFAIIFVVPAPKTCPKLPQPTSCFHYNDDLLRLN